MKENINYFDKPSILRKVPDQLTMQSGRVKFQVCRRFEALWAVLARKPLTLTIINQKIYGGLCSHSTHPLKMLHLQSF